MKAVAVAVAGLLCALGTSGCASMFMHGGKLVDPGYNGAVKTSFRAPTCNVNGSAVNGPDVVFEVVQDASGPALFERSPNGSGAVITNYWSDDKADHYFGWVLSNGWEYVISKDPAVPSTRLVYTGVQLSEVGGVTKPTSSAAGSCPLVPEPGKS